MTQMILPTKVEYIEGLKSHPLSDPECELCLRVSVRDSKASWQYLTSCRVLLPPRSGIMIQIDGSSDTALARSLSELARPTNLIGRTGQILWRPSTPLPTMATIAIAHGQTVHTVLTCQVQKSLKVEWLLFRRTSGSRVLSQQNRLRRCGANKIWPTTSLNDAEKAGLANLFVFTTKRLTNSFARWVLWMAR
jgi:hypothetical protein